MAAHSKNFVFLVFTVSIGLQSVTDERTHTDAEAMAKTREAFCYRA